MAVDHLPPLPRRLLGLGMIALAVLLLLACVAAYNKIFTSTVPVSVQIDQVDNSFEPQSDVRFHGVTVGQVTKVTTNGRFATLDLELDPAQAARIPGNVTASLRPESLFGERYVALVSPSNPVPRAIQAGAVITRDRSSSTIQVEQVFNNLLPLLTAVRPAEIASTLGAISQGLSGRGAQLGDTISLLHTYLSQLNPALPDLTTDLRELPGVTDTYRKAAPDLIVGLKNLTTTTRTLQDKRDDFAKLYRGVTDTSDDLRGFLDRYGDPLVDFVGAARPTIDLLARYSPEFPCLFNRLAAAIPNADIAFGKGTSRPELHVTGEIVATREKFLPHQDEPDYTDNRGPMCYPQVVPLPQYPGGPAKDGSTHLPASPQSAQLATGSSNGAPLNLLGGPPLTSTMPKRDARKTQRSDKTPKDGGIPLFGGSGPGSSVRAGAPR